MHDMPLKNLDIGVFTNLRTPPVFRIAQRRVLHIVLNIIRITYLLIYTR
jgi:hypothetical protein